MKLKIVHLLAFIFMACEVYAAPVLPRTMWLTLADGSTVEATTVGDEHWHGYKAVDGRLIAEAPDGKYYYIDGANAERQALKSPRRATESRLRRLTTLGSPRVPVLLVEYPDKLMSNSFDDIKRHFCDNDSSAYHYFADQSNGKFSPQFDFYGIYPLPSQRAYYGTNDSNGMDKGLGRMIMDAVALAGDDVDWSQYDNDGDGEADVCIVVYAGVGENQATGVVSKSVWPCNWSLTEAKDYGEPGCEPITRNGVTIDKFAVFNEVYGWRDSGTELDGIGVFCHEFSHCLGLPDFYPTVNVSYYGMNNWSLMDNGCYNNRGYTPIGYSAYEKHFMGWLDLVVPRNDSQYVLPVLNSGNDVAVKIVSDINANECYIIENRARRGWDAYIRDEGVLITHFSYIKSRWNGNTVNNGEVQLATIVAADNDWSFSSESTDLYGRDNHELTDTSMPSAGLYLNADGIATGTAGMLGKPITEITLHADGTASFWYAKGFPSQDVDGDVNGDGIVDVEDVNLAINIVLHLNDDDVMKADIDKNGIVDVEDVNALINLVLHNRLTKM